MYGLRYRGQYPEPVASELDAMLSAIRSWLTVDHNEDGTHREEAIAESVGVLGVTDVIGSIQSGTITFSNGGSNAPTATITSVDTTKSHVILNGFTADSAVTVNGVAVQLTSDTVVTGRRDSASNGASIVLYFTVVEYV